MLWMQAFLLHRLTSRQVIDGRMKIKGKEVGEGVKEGVKEWSKWAGGVIYRPGVQRQIDLVSSATKMPGRRWEDCGREGVRAGRD
jgi:hypothetical protein